jgi:hypothetical protein
MRLRDRRVAGFGQPVDGTVVVRSLWVLRVPHAAPFRRLACCIALTACDDPLANSSSVRSGTVGNQFHDAQLADADATLAARDAKVQDNAPPETKPPDAGKVDMPVVYPDTAQPDAANADATKTDTASACKPMPEKCNGKDDDCDDGNPCTSDTCDKKSGTCKLTPTIDAQPCTDNGGCTTGDACKDSCCGTSSLGFNSCVWAMNPYPALYCGIKP